MLADRYGARRLTLAAATLMSGALVAHAIPGFWPLLASRFVFGLGFGTVWTAGIAWITELAPPERRAEVLARPMTIAGRRLHVRPGHLGRRRPGPRACARRSSRRASSGVVVGVLLLRVPEPVVVHRPATPPLRETLRRAATEPAVVGSLGLVLIASCVSSAIYLLVPLQLHDDGLSARGIGAAFSIGAIVFVLTS